MTPLVTIAIPTYRRLHYLQEAVASALSQRYQPLEVLIGDDGDETPLRVWCEQQTAVDPRVRYQKNPKNLGLAGNWNALAEAARGEWLTIIGDDDRLLPDFAQRLTSAIVPTVDVVFAHHHLIDSEGKRMVNETAEHTRCYFRDQLPAGSVAHPETWVWRNVVPMSASLLRTEAVRRLRFHEDLNTPEIEFFARLAQQGGGFVFVPEYLAEYRVHAQSATTAGLWSERLAERLLALPVRTEAEPYKRAFMAPLLVNAVSRCLQQGEMKRARNFLRSEYYPQPLWRHARGLVQFWCAGLPPSLGAALYRSFLRAKMALAATASGRK